MTSKGTIDLLNYKKQKKIGQGGFSEVYQILEKGSGEIYAGKISLKEMDLNSPEEMLYIKREVNIISKLEHPSILKFIGYSKYDFNNEPRPVIVTEYSSNGSLKQILELERSGLSPLGWDQTKKLVVIYGIAVGMAYLHSHDIIHRDLKPDNIFLDDDLLPKIADFGLSKFYHNKSSVSSGGIKGTPAYMAPEIWRSTEYQKASDVYSFSLIVYEIITGEIPFQNFSMLQVLQKIVEQGYRPEFKYPIPDSYRKLIEDCWDQTPDNRPSFEDIVENLIKDSGFIAEGVDKKDFSEYVNFIKESVISFEIGGDVIPSIRPGNTKNKDESISYPAKDLPHLRESCQKLVQEAKENFEKQFLVGKSLFKGTLGFPRNLELGIKYLKSAIKKGSIDSAKFYCRILIEGKVIPPDLEKAEKYLKLYLHRKDTTIYTLYGLAKKQEGNYEEAIKYLKKSSSAGNAEAMYEYGMMFLKGQGVPVDSERGSECIEMAKNNGFTKKEDNIKSPKSKDEKRKRKRSTIELKIINSSIFKKLDESCQNSVIAAEEGDSPSLLYVSQGFLEGINNFPLNKKLGLEYLKYATDHKVIECMKIYGDFYLNGNLVHKNEEKAINILNEAATISKSSEMKLKLVDILLSHQSYDINSKENVNVNYPLAKKCCKEAADMGNTKAMVMYGLLCMKEKKTDYGKINYNFKEAFDYFKLAAESEDPEGMAHYGRFLHHGYGVVDINQKEAVEYYKKSYNKENLTGCALYGRSLIQGVEVPKNEIEGIRLLKYSCDNKNSYGMAYYGYFVNLGLSKLKRDVNSAVRYFKRSADLGCHVAMANYGICLRDGVGVKKDIKTAIEYFKLAVEEGNPRAAFILGNILTEPKKANKYLQFAAEHGIKQAMHQFSLNMYYKRGIEMNVNLLKKYLINGINLGSQSCMRLYGNILMKGDVLPLDKYEGVRYFKMAADLGDKIAMNLYADSLESGEGVMINKKEAQRYRELAKRDDH